MKLSKFHITNYRSVLDSGEIEVRKLTSMIGRNESGKTNLLRALQTLNPPDKKLLPLSLTKDLPRNRQYNDDSSILVVNTLWDLDQEEAKAIAEIHPKLNGVTKLEIFRFYDDIRIVRFVGASEASIPDELILNGRKALLKYINHLNSSITEEQVVTEIGNAYTNLITLLNKENFMYELEAEEILASLKLFLSKIPANVALHPTLADALGNLEQHIHAFIEDRDLTERASNYISDIMPIFIFFDEYPNLNGHQNLQELTSKKEAGKELSENEKNFEKLMKVAELDAGKLHELKSTDYEKRKILTRKASAKITRKLNQLWSDRNLVVTFQLDGDYFNTLISDSSSPDDNEINLDERSKGFKWFFSFYVIFAADTLKGNAENAILLFDEPGLHLHAVAQQDLLTQFRKELNNQIIYTTHSPFMVPIEEFTSIRIVELSDTHGTKVNNNLSGDVRSLLPLRVALGYEVAQSLFLSENNLVVEGIVDFYYLGSFSHYLRKIGRNSLSSNVTLLPAGGASKVQSIVSLLVSNNLKVNVLLDKDKAGIKAEESLVAAGLITSNNIIFISDIITSDEHQEYEIENLFTAPIYEYIVRKAYEDELSNVIINLEAKIPRITKRYESAFEQVQLKFDKAKVARIFTQLIIDEEDYVTDELIIENFVALFKLINSKFKGASISLSTS